MEQKNGSATDILYGVAAKVHEMLGGDYQYFSGLNDRRSKRSSHSQGRAFDLVLNDPSKYSSIADKIRTLDKVKLSQFEPLGYRNTNGSVSTGDHIHTEVSARNGFNGMLTGPSSGYRPNIEMHGREQLSITPANAGSTANLMGAESADMMRKQLEKMDQMVQGINQSGAQNIMAMQLDRLDELVRVMQNQVNVSTKILQQSR